MLKTNPTDHPSQLAEKLLLDQEQLVKISKITDPKHPLSQIVDIALKKVYQSLYQSNVSNLFIGQIKTYWIPIANNFGMWEIRYLIEDRLFELLDKKNYQLICSLIKHKQKIHQNLFQSLVDILSHYLHKADIQNFDIIFRQKNIYGIYNKMQQKHQNINYMTDWFGIRILVDTPEECYKVMEILHHLWRPYPEFLKDYIKNRKSNGYQSIHTTLYCLEGQTVEFQIRTKEMDYIAKYGTASHAVYKRLYS